MSSWGSIRTPRVRKYYFVIFLLTYILNTVGSLLIVLTVVSSQTLDVPMYFFLGNLSFTPIQSPQYDYRLILCEENHFFPSLHDSSFYRALIWWCWDFTPVVMAYDRYMAICKPLHHMTIMNQWICILLLLLAWIGGFLYTIVHILFVYNLPFCGTNVIDHFRCDMYPLLKLACTDIGIIGFTVLANDGVTCVVLFTLLLIFCGVNLRSLKNLKSGR